MQRRTAGKTMDAYGILKQLLLPPGIILLLLGCGLLLVRGRLGRTLLLAGWLLLLGMSLPGVLAPVMSRLEHVPALPPDAVAGIAADAILVLGATVDADAPEYGGHVPDVNSLVRVRYAAWLHHRTGLPVYVSGGAGEEAPGPAMARVLEQDLGVPVAAVERDSGSTWENAERSAPMLRRAGVRRVLLVTQAWHMPRAVAVFRRFGVEVVPAPTYFLSEQPRSDGPTGVSDWLPQANTFHASYYALHELIGVLYYRLRGWWSGAAAD